MDEDLCLETVSASSAIEDPRLTRACCRLQSISNAHHRLTSGMKARRGI
jgi:hypothetical protein